MSSHEDRPLLTLLSLATQRQRDTLVRALATRGFDDIALAGARILAAVAEAPQSIQALAEATETTKQFTAREVRKLEKSRYVAVEISPLDRRVSLVRKLARGSKLLEASHQIKHALDAALERKLGVSEVRALRRNLLRLLEE